MKILVTGGAGYIGSHTVVTLLQQGHEVAIVDNLSNSKKAAVERVGEIAGKKPAFYECDVRDEEKLREAFVKEQPQAVIHFAGLKAVGESVAQPLRYYDNNLNSTLVLLKVMAEQNVNNIIFSSSATVYGEPATVPIREDFTLPSSAACPYGNTKLMIEHILTDYVYAHPGFSAVLLRYFNPVGAHESGLIGEDPNGIPNNLAPYIAQTVVGKLEKVHIYGNDYPTPDGTGVRDYIHVVDLAEGHAAALQLFKDKPCGLKVYNLGTGKGCSVLEMIAAFSKAAGKEIPYVIDPRRPGDIPTCYADCSLAKRELGWEAKKNVDDMCADTLRWQRMNPNGFED
ncbi:UDP-glucose 4-epimerase GalE [Acutalibacter caecimuris]|uniref:UDP-glucose 4-epimerase GalE n=1 Tax=Acutalibacter caecimuris TaxID=3093657 RepID=UPI002AC89864|nr:UDP-glucose 4-epimerase GalE [Acutalibacter sp. M00118]